MKNKIIVLLFAIATLVALLWLFHRGEKPRPDLALNTPSTNALPVENAVQPNVNAPSTNDTVNASLTTGQTTLPASYVAAEEKARAMIEAKNIPIDFYGRVIDQDSNSLFGVKIHAGIRHWQAIMSASSIPIERETDADGRFEIHNVSGDSFGVLLLKDGYEAESEKNSFGGGPSGSYENPMIFKMWSTNIHETLITGNKSFEIVPDGKPHFINLTDGTISEQAGGDLKVWIQYTNQVVRGQLYDWSAGIDVVNGGLWEVPQAAMNSGFIDQFTIPMYVAPTDGYVSSFSHKGQIKGGQSGEIGDRYFYLLINNGKEYGRMHINLFAPYGKLHPGLIRLSYAINPSGSRILR